MAGLFLASLLWFAYDDAQVRQQLGRRYVSYDREFEFHPASGMIQLALFFALPNLVLVVIQLFRNSRPDRE